MPNKSSKLSDELRRAIQGSGKSQYRICKETGIDKGLMSRFVSGKGGLSMEGIDKLAECLGVTLLWTEAGLVESLAAEQARAAREFFGKAKRGRARKAK